MDWFLYDNGPRHERVKSFYKRSYTIMINLMMKLYQYQSIHLIKLRNQLQFTYIRNKFLAPELWKFLCNILIQNLALIL